MGQSLRERAVAWLDSHGEELIGWRRDLHAHPEVAYAEHRTTERIAAVLASFGLRPTPLSAGTGLTVDVGTGPEATALRADIDALPLPDHKQVSYASQHPGCCHACGHDAHTAILLGTAGVLAEADRAGALAGRVRLIFQPAEERMPGGAEVVVNDGKLDEVGRIFALHCDPKLDVGQVGLRVGPITASFNQLEIQLTGPGGHTARPHLTVDVVYALGRLITELPGVLSRRIDPRAAVSLVWGAVHAGSAPNAIPNSGTLSGTLRMLDGFYWDQLEGIVAELAEQIVEPTGAELKIDYDPGVPAVINDGTLVALQTQAAIAALGPESVSDTPQSMGGEDFAWYLRTVPGSLARLGVRTPGSTAGDLHKSDFDIDERALSVGVRFTAALLDEVHATLG
ncbi:MAG TPA: amidohydrolase [Jatrophihabitans sp.]|nr:amidohydrolase [Jatrophihabitans sp.]